MTKLKFVRITLIFLQLLSLSIATVIIIVHYNPWIEKMIVEAEKSGNAPQSLADQITRIEGEEIVIFFMSAATILVSLIGIVGTLRGHEHNHCLLNFYMSTLIIFLFVIFVALCGTLWEMISKLQHQNQSSAAGDKITLNSVEPLPDSNIPAPGSPSVTWLYLSKSLFCIVITAALYATSWRLTRKILESSDDRYLSASEDDDDMHSEASSVHGIHHYINGNRRMLHNNNNNHLGAYNNQVYSGAPVGGGGGAFGKQFESSNVFAKGSIASDRSSNGGTSPFRNI